MDYFHTLILALIQGITEFLPVSSSAHLIFPSHVFGWKDQGLSFDVAVHLGTLVAVMVYYRHWLLQIAKDVIQNPGLVLKARSSLSNINTNVANPTLKQQSTHKQHSADQSCQLFANLVIASVPVFIVGGVLEFFWPEGIRSTAIIAWSTIVFGLVLYVSEKFAHGNKDEYELGLKIALFIGLAQTLALIPGTSRSGITISAALLLGMSAQGSANFSFLLSIPTILAASLIKSISLVKSSVPIDWSTLLLGAIVSGIFAYFTIEWFLAFLKRVGMVPFVIYRLILGIILLAFFTGI